MIIVDNRPIRRKAIAKCKNILSNDYDDYETSFDGDFNLTDEEIEEFNRILSMHPAYENILNNPELYEKFFKEFKCNFFSSSEERRTESVSNEDDNSKIGADIKSRLKNIFRSLAFKPHTDNNEHDPIKL